MLSRQGAGISRSPEHPWLTQYRRTAADNILSVLWQARVDGGTCFGLCLAPDEQHLVVHGELEMSKVAVDGRKLWAFSGEDIFTGDCVVYDSAVMVTDFTGQRYTIDLESGRGGDRLWLKRWMQLTKRTEAGI